MMNGSDNNKSLRMGIIGLGAGRFMGVSSREVKGVEVAAICDLDAGRLASFGIEFDIPESAHYNDYQQMFAEANLDLIHIALPNSLHEQVAVAALEAGIDTIVEKPMTTDTASAQRMVDAEARSSKRLMVVYNRRYRADTQWARSMFEDGKLGDVYHVNVHWRRETGIPGSGWFGNKALAGGGPLIDLGVHVMDMALFVLGYPRVLTVSGQTWGKFGHRGQKVNRWRKNPDTTPPMNFDVEDNAVGFVRLEGNTTMSVQASWAEHTKPKADHIYVEFQGTEGSIVIDIPNYTKDDTVRYYTSMNGEAVTVAPNIRWYRGGHYQHAGFLNAAVQHLLNGTPPPSTAAEGLTMTRILEGIYQSAERGQELVMEPVEA